MDFLLGLPRTKQCFYYNFFLFFDGGLILEDGQFFTMQKMTYVRVAQLHFQEVYRLHGLPSSIVLDGDTHFLSHF